MTQEMLPTAVPPTEPAAKNSFARILGVLISPRETFEDINRKQDWLIPLIVIVVLALVSTYVFMSHADVLELIKTQLEKSGRTVPSDEALQGSLKITSIITYVSVLIVAPISLVVVAGILFVVFAFILGAETDFKKVFSANLYASMTSLVKTVIAIPVLFVKQPSEFGNPADVVQSNLGILIDPSQKALHALGKSIDVFTIWYLIVMAIGMVGVSKNLTFKKAMTTMIALWAIVVAIAVTWAAFKG
jgi:hypothetical protein